MNQETFLYQEIVNIATIVALLVAFIIAAIQFCQSKKELKHKNNLEFLKNRKELRDRLIELMNYPKNCYEYYNLRRVTDPTIVFDEHQPMLPENMNIPNSGFYRTIAGDLYNLSSEVKIWFPTLEHDYSNFISSVRSTVTAPSPTKKADLANESIAKFDAIIEKMNTIMSESLQ